MGLPSQSHDQFLLLLLMIPRNLPQVNACQGSGGALYFRCYMSKTDRKLIEVHRLSEEVYSEIERRAAVPFVSDKTTQLQTAFYLGQQSILKLLREGVVVRGI